jgi:hypothetical protein
VEKAPSDPPTSFFDRLTGRRPTKGERERNP